MKNQDHSHPRKSEPRAHERSYSDASHGPVLKKEPHTPPHTPAEKIESFEFGIHADNIREKFMAAFKEYVHGNESIMLRRNHNHLCFEHERMIPDFYNATFEIREKILGDSNLAKEICDLAHNEALKISLRPKEHQPGVEQQAFELGFQVFVTDVK